MGFNNMSDAEFVAAFENCALDAAAFHHIDHLRLARIYVNKMGGEVAARQLLSGIRKFATNAGVPNKFHHTATIAWLKLVAAACSKENTELSFTDWIQENLELQNTQLLSRLYSKERFESDEARTTWMEPDLSPF